MKKTWLFVITLSLFFSHVYGYSSTELRNRLSLAIAEHAIEQGVGGEREMHHSPYLYPESVPNQIQYSLSIPSYLSQSNFFNAQTDILSDGRYYQSPIAEVSLPIVGGYIDTVRSQHASTEVRGSQISLATQQLELYVDLKDTNGSTLNSVPGYIVIALIEGKQKLLSYQYASQSWYFTHHVDSDTRSLELLLLCESCGGRKFGEAGPYANWQVADTLRYSIVPVKYRGYDQLPDTNDARYFLTTSKSFAIQAEQIWTQQQSFIVELAITNESVRPGRLSTNDFKVTLQSQNIPTSQLSYRVDKGLLSCEDGQGSSLQVRPMGRCTLELKITINNIIDGGQIGLIIEHTTSTNKHHVVNRRVTLPRITK